MAVKSLSQSTVRQAPPVNSLLAGYQGNQFHHLETIRLGGTAASVEFTNLSRYSDYQHLQIRTCTLSSTAYWYTVRLNADATTSKYRSHFLRGNGSAVDSQTWDGSAGGMQLIGHTGSTTAPGVSVVDILDPFDTSKNTTLRGLTGFVGNEVVLTSGAFFDTAAINSIAIRQESTFLFVAGSRISLYGIKARA